MLNNNCLESEVYMKRKIYESPLTLRTEVELESEFMGKASLGDEPKDSEGTITIKEQTPGVAIGGSGDGWDNSGNWDNKWD